MEPLAFWPLWILALSIGVIVLLITVLRVHPFFALFISAILVGLLASQLPGDPDHPHWVQALLLAFREFALTAANIGLVILLASVIGVCLMASGAAEKIVRRLISLFGEANAGLALLASGFVLGIPVFFDTVFFLLIPIARALSLRARNEYLFYVLAICGGGVITHSLVAPTPGPLIMADLLGLDLGLTILAGVASGILPALAALWMARRLNFNLALQPTLPDRASGGSSPIFLNEPDEKLPQFFPAILPVLLPVLLIATASFYRLGQNYFPALEEESFAWLQNVVTFAGHRNFAMFAGTMIALAVLVRQRRPQRADLFRLLSSPMKTALIIILITSAGGAFGAMIRHAGVGEAIKAAVEGREMSFIFLAWLISSVLKFAQGSGTVAMITTAGMMFSMLQDQNPLPYHPVYIFIAIGFGSMTLSWMNDSAFWVVGKLSGFSVPQTLKSWTVLLGGISILGLLQTLACSFLLPFASN
jgi:gluconate:H+ symporter, GntP family